MAAPLLWVPPRVAHTSCCFTRPSALLLLLLAALLPRCALSAASHCVCRCAAVPHAYGPHVSNRCTIGVSQTSTSKYGSPGLGESTPGVGAVLASWALTAWAVSAVACPPLTRQSANLATRPSRTAGPGANSVVCYSTSQGAGSARNASYCATGAAAGAGGFSWVVTAALPPLSVAAPNGAGNLCFVNNSGCTSGTWRSSCSTCVVDAAFCGHGIAGNLGGYSFFCPADQPASAVANGAGALCFSSFSACLSSSANSCGLDFPCTLDEASCSTGQSSNTGQSWFCPRTTPPGAVPNGGGSYCYANVSACQSGPNICGWGGTPCNIRSDLCSTGQAGGTGYWAFCEADLPGWAGPNAPPAAWPNGNGNLCWRNQTACNSGANACGPGPTSCVLDEATCASGLSEGQPGYFFICELETPAGATPNGGGELCYSSDLLCSQGPNACGPALPCVYDTSTCSTGPAAAQLSVNWFCPATVPPGAVHNGAGCALRAVCPSLAALF